jgi:Uma2 family endonuclease
MLSANIRRFTVEDYHWLTEKGFFAEDDRVELIRGQVVQMAAKGTAHEVCLNRLLKVLIKEFKDDRAIVRCQSPIVLFNESEPEPDFSIVQYREDEYLSAHPLPADVLLIIEISDSSLDYDRETKLPLYAEAGIYDYWIFNLQQNVLETYCEPYQNNDGEFGYRLKKIVLPNETIVLPQFPDLVIDLGKIFPPIRRS